MKIYIIRRLAGMVVPLPTSVVLSKSKATDSRSKNYNFRHGNFKNNYQVLLKVIKFLIFVFFGQSGTSYAVEWYVDTDVPPHLFPSPKTACEAIKAQYSSPTRNLQINPLDMYRFECVFQILLPYSKEYMTYQRVATMAPYVSCDEVADVNTGRCRGSGEIFSDKEVYKSSFACAITPFVGNPVSVSSGNKFQNYDMYLWRGHDDMPLNILYNSRTGLWRHNFSSKIVFDSGVVLLLGEDGSVFKFQNINGVYVSRDVVGELIKTESDWLYRSSTGLSYYNNLGQLSRVSDGAHVIVIERSQGSLALKMDSTESVQLFEDGFGQLTKLISNDGVIDYKYDDSGHLLELHKVYSQGVSAIRRFEYADVRDSKLLTGITDERGVRYATWSYDDQGRAISSEHAGGAEKVTLAYNDDGSTTVTNALGKQTTYRFQVIQGVKRITAIEGEPTADCPAANSTYTYNDRGQVLTATDAEGRVTRYAYNDRGLEISRIEGEGTAEARTVTTEWDAERYRRTQVTADGRRTLYSYDDQGRLLSERTEAVSAN